MAVKFLFLAFCPSRTLSQPRFPQWSILAERMLTEPGMWTVWAAAKSPSVWLPEPCLVLSLPLSLPLSLGWLQGPVDRSRGNQLVCTLMALFIWTVTIINSIISYLLYHCDKHTKSHGKKKKSGYHLEYLKWFQRFSKTLLGNLGWCGCHTPLPYANHSHGG